MPECKFCHRPIVWKKGFGTKFYPTNPNGTNHKCWAPKKIQVHCSKCKQFVDEDKVTFHNIEEDIFGKDVMTFDCPLCGTRQSSHRLG